MLVGYDSESKAYRVYGPKRRKVIITRFIDESRVGFHELKNAKIGEDNI